MSELYARCFFAPAFLTPSVAAPIFRSGKPIRDGPFILCFCMGLSVGPSFCIRFYMIFWVSLSKNTREITVLVWARLWALHFLKFSFYIEKLFPLGRDSTLKSILLFVLLLVNLQWVLKEFLQIVKCFSGYYLDFSCLLKEFFVFLDHRIIFGIFLKEPCLILKFPSLNIQ